MRNKEESILTKKIITETDVKRILGIDNFENPSKDKVSEFISLIPYMDKEVAISIIEQFSNYTDATKEMIESLDSAIKTMIEKDDDSRKDVIEVYKLSIDKISDTVNDNSSEEYKKDIAETIVHLADKIYDKDTEEKRYHVEMTKTIERTIMCLSILGITILGINYKYRTA